MLIDCFEKEHKQGMAPDGQPFRIFTLTNTKGMKVQVMDWGGNLDFLSSTGRKRSTRSFAWVSD